MELQSTPSTLVGATPNKVVPLLQQLGRLEEITSSLALRLDPITQHEPATDKAAANAPSTVTQRIASVGDTLQYLLDHIEL